MLQTFTETRQGKMKDAYASIGKPWSDDRQKCTSENRGIFRSFLAGVGVPSSLYESATLEELDAAYASFAHSSINHEDGARGLIPILMRHGFGNAQGITETLRLARTRHNATNPWGYGLLLDTPTPKEDQAAIYHFANLYKSKGNNTMSNAIENPTFWNQKGGEIDPNAMPNGTPTPNENKGNNNGQATPAEGTPAEATPEGKTPNDKGTGQKNNDQNGQPQGQELPKDAAAALEAFMKAMMPKAQKAELDEERVIELIHENAAATRIILETPQGRREIESGLHHYMLPTVLKMVDAGVNVMMVGAAGSGKTTLAETVAKIMGLDFYFNGALSSEYKLSGFVDAQGRIVRTAFREAYEKGGLYLFDEIDASMPDALLAFNAALANGYADFPDGRINRHENFRCLAAANTFGKGADRIYVGRNPLDGASLDRFAVVEIDYDEALERALCGNDDWCDHVQSVRASVWEQKIRHIVSPRASIMGAKLLHAGLSKSDVEDATIWKGLDSDARKKVTANLKPVKRTPAKKAA